MPGNGLDERQWRFTRLHLDYLREELLSLLSWLEGDLEVLDKEFPRVPPGFRAYNKFSSYSEHLRREIPLLTKLLRKLDANHAFDSEDDSFWHGLADYEDDIRAGRYELPSELQREIDHDLGFFPEDDMPLFGSEVDYDLLGPQDELPE